MRTLKDLGFNFYDEEELFKMKKNLSKKDYELCKNSKVVSFDELRASAVEWLKRIEEAENDADKSLELNGQSICIVRTPLYPNTPTWLLKVWIKHFFNLNNDSQEGKK